MAHAALSPQSRQEASPKIVDLFTGRAVSEEESPPYNYGPINDEPPTVTAAESATDLDAAIFAHHGMMVLGFWRALLLMDGQGIPITYATAMEFCGLKRRTVFYYAKALAESGAITIDRTRGGRGNESVINCAGNRAQNGAPLCTVVRQTVQETVHGTPLEPPIREETVTDWDESESEAGQETSQENRKGGAGGNRKAPSRLQKDFDRFWAVYPNGDEKKQAVAQWKRLKPSPELVETIMQAVERQKQTPKWKAGYVKAAFRWLRDANWEDEAKAANTTTPDQRPGTPFVAIQRYDENGKSIPVFD